MKVFAYYTGVCFGKERQIKLYADTTKGRRKLAEEIINRHTQKSKDELVNYKKLIIHNSPILLNDNGINGYIKSYEVEG